MAEYILPQVLVFQDFQRTVAAVEQPLRAFYAGPNAQLIRFDNADEQADGLLGSYDKISDQLYDWPSRPGGGKADQTYTKIYVKDAVLRYFTDLIGQGTGIVSTTLPSLIVAPSLVFKTGNGYDRSAAFGDRDVQVGDWAYVRAVVGSEVYELETEVTGVLPVTNDPAVAAAVNATSNPSNQSLVTTPSVTKTAGVDNCISLSASASSYDGLTSGDINETYTVRVVQSSAGGDLTTGRVRLISASGRDDVLTVAPSDDGVQFTIGARGLKLTFHRNVGSCSTDAQDDEAPTNDIVAGQEWQFAVQSAYTKPTPASNGGINYSGARDTTYIVEVTRGGLFAATNKPQITCTTTNGIDVSGPTNVTAVNTFVAAGTKGVQIKFTGVTGLRKGDRFEISCTASAPAQYYMLKLRDALDPAIPEGTDLDLKLGIKKSSMLLPKNKIESAPNVNWSTDADNITVKASATAYDSSWTVSGVAEPLPLEKGTLYAHTRYWLSDVSDGYHEMYDPGQLNAVPGPIHPDNPLKFALHMGLQNNNGVGIGYMAVNDPDDEDEWVRVLGVIEEKKVYGLVPLTRNATFLGLFQGHVNDQSTPEQANWRSMWTVLESVPNKVLVNAETSSDGEEVLATFLIPLWDENATKPTAVRVPTGNGKFLTRGVRARDKVRTNFSTDGFGNEVYDEYEVDDVLSEDQLLLTPTGTPAFEITTAQRIEVWRNLSAFAEAEEIVKQTGFYGNRRVCAVWPDKTEVGGLEVDGMYIAAAYAALRSGIPPHQGMTRLELSGFDNMDRTTKKFSRAQLNQMAKGGVFIVTQDSVSGKIFCRHAVTTADYDVLEFREEMIRANVDHVSYQIFAIGDPYIGVANVTESFANKLKTMTNALIQKLIETEPSVDLGGQLREGSTVLSVTTHAVLKDRLVVDISGVFPAPLNNIENRLQVVI